ncbi:riboflavin synthase [Desulfovibrionales bacterium]
MFTGIIQGIGHIVDIKRHGKETRLTIRPAFSWAAYERGESIAVNGVCLTVETFGADWFTAYASAETMAVTNLGTLRSASPVNLERALAMGDRLGGHIVSGHVDCLAEVTAIQPAGESRQYTLTFPHAFAPQVIVKGSVALDGISLTVNDCGPEYLAVNIIPATQQETTISTWTPGQRVNMETDIIGKYVQKMLGPWAPGPTASAITLDFLRENGF